MNYMTDEEIINSRNAKYFDSFSVLDEFGFETRIYWIYEEFYGWVQTEDYLYPDDEWMYEPEPEESWNDDLLFDENEMIN